MINLSTLKTGDTVTLRCGAKLILKRIHYSMPIECFFEDGEGYRPLGYYNDGISYVGPMFDIVDTNPTKSVREGKIYAVVDNTVDECVYLTTNPSKMFINSTLAVVEIGSWKSGDGLELLKGKKDV